MKFGLVAACLQIYSSFLTNDNSLHLFNLSVLKKGQIYKLFLQGKPSLKKRIFCGKKLTGNQNSSHPTPKYTTIALKLIIIKAWICEERDQSLFVCGVHIVKEAAAVILA